MKSASAVPTAANRKVHTDITRHTELFFKNGEYNLTKDIDGSQKIKRRNTEKSDNTETM